MFNIIWIFLVLISLLSGAILGKLDAVAKAVTDSAGTGVTICLGLIGTMTLWLGLMKVLEEGGLMPKIASLLRPIMKRLFPEIPERHPAMSMMVMNISANFLGMSNAATPFGLKAISELNKLNPCQGIASNSMARFLVINTSGVVLFPTTMIALRASLGSRTPAAILITTLVSAAMATIFGLLSCFFFERFYPTPGKKNIGPEVEVPSETTNKILAKNYLLAIGVAIVCASAFAIGIINKKNALLIETTTISEMHAWAMASKSIFLDWPLLLLISAIMIFASYRKVGIYDCIVSAGKEGFDTAIRIIPYLVAVLVAVGMLRSSGAIEILSKLMDPITSLIGMPTEALPMALLRPFTGSGSLAIASEIMKSNGPDSLVGNIVSTMYGSSETTFYVLAVYFGSVQVKDIRHTLTCCLIADTVGAVIAVWSVRWFLL